MCKEVRGQGVGGALRIKLRLQAWWQTFHVAKAPLSFELQWKGSLRKGLTGKFCSFKLCC